MADQLPIWIKTRVSLNRYLQYTLSTIEDIGLNTVCQSAHCPNIGECFSKKIVTFMIMGDNCTRDCSFCAVEHGPVSNLDPQEPEKVALAAKSLGLKHVVITSVTRDDLEDCGSSHYASCIEQVRKLNHDVSIEVLTPDFLGINKNIATVVMASPDVYNHNLETVPRLYPFVRVEANYLRSLRLLETVKFINHNMYTKSGIMVGLGEKMSEVYSVMKDLRSAGCDFLTIGQYLQPSTSQLKVNEYIRPEVFEDYRLVAIDAGFLHVASAPLVRSSYLTQDYLSVIRT